MSEIRREKLHKLPFIALVIVLITAMTAGVCSAGVPNLPAVDFDFDNPVRNLGTITDPDDFSRTAEDKAAPETIRQYRFGGSAAAFVGKARQKTASSSLEQLYHAAALSASPAETLSLSISEELQTYGFSSVIYVKTTHKRE